MQRLLRLSSLGALVIVAGLAAATPVRAQQEDDDPLEGFNRSVWSFNQTLDRYALRPVASAYRRYVPGFARTGAHNFLTNLRTPITVVNAALQGDGRTAVNNFGRFMTNTTLGVGGLLDVATDAGLPATYEDFGQTMGTYGVGSGPFLMVPLLGPSNPRDFGGTVVDSFFDPLNYAITIPARVGRVAAESVDFRERNLEAIDNLEASSLDYYAAVRSAYLQNRANQVGGTASAVAPGAGRRNLPLDQTPPDDLYEVPSDDLYQVPE